MTAGRSGSFLERLRAAHKRQKERHAAQHSVNHAVVGTNARGGVITKNDGQGNAPKVRVKPPSAVASK